MTCKFVFAVLAALFIAQNAASTLDSLHRMEKNLNKTIEFLTSYKDQLPVKSDEKFVACLGEGRDMTAKMIGETLKKIDKKLKDAGNAESNAQNCKAVAEAELESANNTVIPQLEKCVQDNKPDWSPIQAEISEIIAEGGTFRNEMHAIENDCVADPTSQEKCFGSKLPEVGRRLGSFHGTVGKLKGKGEKTTGIALRTASSCSKATLRTFKKEQKIVKKKAFRCIESAQ